MAAGRTTGRRRNRSWARSRVAVEEALELLHDDYAYEFQIGWSLWELETTGKQVLRLRYARSG